METRTSLRHIPTHGGLAGRHRRQPPRAIIRAGLALGLLALAIALGSLGAAALGLPVHSIAGHIATSFVKAVPQAWMY